MNTPNASKSSSDPEPRNGARQRRVALAARALAPLVQRWVEASTTADAKFSAASMYLDESIVGTARRAMLEACKRHEADVVRARTTRGGRPLTRAAQGRLASHKAVLRARATWERITAENPTPREYAGCFADLSHACELARRVERHARSLARAAGQDHALVADFAALRCAARNYDSSALGATWALLVGRLAAAPIPAMGRAADLVAVHNEQDVNAAQAIMTLQGPLRDLLGWGSDEKYPDLWSEGPASRCSRAAASSNFRKCAKAAGKSSFWRDVHGARTEDGRFNFRSLLAIAERHAADRRAARDSRARVAT